MYRYISCCRICCCNYYMFIFFSWRISFFELSCSLRSKRFRLVSEQKETVEGDFRFWSREKLNENQTEPPFFARSLTLVPRSLLLNRTETLATQTNFQGWLSERKSFSIDPERPRKLLYQYWRAIWSILEVLNPIFCIFMKALSRNSRCWGEVNEAINCCCQCSYKRIKCGV